MQNSFQHLIKSDYYETLNQVQGDKMGVFQQTDAKLNLSYRYEGLVNYIAGKYDSAVEIGIGHFPDVAFALLKRGLQVFATDVRPFQYTGLEVIVHDIMEPDLSAYTAIDLIYSLRPPPELVPYMVRLARKLSSDLIIKSLASEHTGGQLVRHGNTTFFQWNYL